MEYIERAHPITPFTHLKKTPNPSASTERSDVVCFHGLG